MKSYNYRSETTFAIVRALVGAYSIDQLYEIAAHHAARGELPEHVTELFDENPDVVGPAARKELSAQECLAYNWHELEIACTAFGADLGGAVRNGYDFCDRLIRAFYETECLHDAAQYLQRFFAAFEGRKTC